MKRSVFLTYARGDEGAVQELRAGLDNAEIAAWMDGSDVAAGKAIARDLREAITKASVVLVVVSERSEDDPWVLFEIGAALELQKPLIPIILDQKTDGAVSDWLQGLRCVDAQGKSMPAVASEINRLLSSASEPEPCARETFWQAIGEVKYSLASEWRAVWGVAAPGAVYARTSPELPADSSYNVLRGSAANDGIRWHIFSNSDGLHIKISSADLGMIDTPIEVKIEDVSITGTPALPPLRLAPCEGVLLAETVVRARDLVVLRERIGLMKSDWTLTLGPVNSTKTDDQS